MLIIGHRGARGIEQENSLDALRAGLDAGVDMLEFDVRLTRDRIPVLAHDFTTLRTHGDASIISRHTYAELLEHTNPESLPTLHDVLNQFYGKVILNIELKGANMAEEVVDVLKSHFVRHPQDWDNVLISSFRASELRKVRNLDKHANLALLHRDNPFLFIAYHRSLRLTAVGFHRHYINRLAIEIARKLGIFTYAYTVNRPHTALALTHKGIDGIVTDDPATILQAYHEKRYA